MKRLSLILCMAALLVAPAAMATNYTVPTDGTLATVLGGALAGDTITILDGTYLISSTLYVNVGVTITGQSEAGVVLQIDCGSGYGFLVASDDVVMENMTLDVITAGVEAGYPIHASGATYAGGYTNLTIQQLTVTGDLTTQPKRRTGIDIHGYNNVILDDIESSDASYGNGVQLTGVVGATLSNITTSNNAWGSIAIYCSGPSYLNRACDNIVIDGATMNLAENNIYQEDQFGLVSTNVSVTSYDYLVYNDFAPGYTFFQETEVNAIALALANPGTESGSSIFRPSDGTWIVAPGMTIQTAIDDASAGATVEVRAGTFVEQLEIAKDLTLQGAGMGVTTVEAFASMPLSYLTPSVNVPVIYVHDADNVEIRDLTVDGAGQGNTNVRFYGIAYRQAGGGVYDCEVKDVRDTPFSGAQHGNAIYLYNNDAVARSMAVQGCQVSGFQNNGITLNLFDATPLVASVLGNTVTGAGATDVTAQNGIQIQGELVTGTVDGNTIFGIAYDNTNNPTKWVATSILDFYSQVDITTNLIDQAHVGIYKIDGQGSLSDNDITIEKIGVYAWGIIGSDPPRVKVSPFDVPADNSKTRVAKAALLPVVIDGNTVAFVGVDNTATYGIEGDAGFGPDDIDLTITNNTVTGFEAGVDVYHGGADIGVFTNVAINNNSFSGNTYGVRSNVTYLTVDATCNWWGDISGPYNPVDNFLATGDPVEGDVLWYPWLDGDIGGSPACTMYPNSIGPVGPVSEITPCNDCVTVPIDITRTDATVIRGMSVTFQLSPELVLCGAGIVPAYGAGSWLGTIGMGDVQDFILDNGGGNYTVDRSILGAACGSDLSGTVFTVDVAAATGGDATGTISVETVTVRDCANAPVASGPGADVSVSIDQTEPAGITNLAAAQQKTGNLPGSTTAVQLSWDAVTDPDVTGISIYRKGFGFYPEYDDDGGFVPVAPTDPTDALANGWALAATLAPAATSHDDVTAVRDFYYYIAFTDDGCLDGAGSNRTDGTLNYHLGDVAVVPGDNLVATIDVSVLGTSYGESMGDTYYNAFVDVGPTTDYSVNALPTTDNVVQFEDLMMFAINYGQVSKDVSAPKPAAFNEITLEVLQPTEERVSVQVHMDGNGTLQGVHVPLRWNSATLRPVGMSEGSLLARQNRLSFVASAQPGEVDAAVFGTDGVGISGSGLLAVIDFEVIGSGEFGIAPGEIIARDASNQEQIISGQVEAGPPTDRLPAATMLHANYPNPFNPKTTISFTLSQPGPVRVNIYSLDGRLVTTLVNEEMAIGQHQMQWTGLDEKGRSVSSGTYLVRLVAPDKVQSQRITLLK